MEWLAQNGDSLDGLQLKVKYAKHIKQGDRMDG